MNKTILTVVGVIGIVLAVLIGIAAFSRNRATQEPVTNTVNTEITNEQNSGTLQKSSLKGLLELNNNNQVCTYDDPEVNSQGTIYLGEGRMRGDMIMQTSDNTLNTHMISDGKFVYIWTDGATEGYKMSLASAEDFENDSLDQSVDIEKEIDFNCSGWQVDTSKFNLPPINFQDFDTFLEQIDSRIPSSDGGTDQCQLCDSLDGEEAATCRSSLGC